jgi:hypothetical protein
MGGSWQYLRQVAGEYPKIVLSALLICCDMNRIIVMLIHFLQMGARGYRVAISHWCRLFHCHEEAGSVIRVLVRWTWHDSNGGCAPVGRDIAPIDRVSR